MRWHIALVGVGYALAALLIALIVILPVFIVINFIYDQGAGIIALLIAVILGWGLLAWLLARRRVRL